MWNECEQQQVTKYNKDDISNQRELLIAFNKEMSEAHCWFLQADNTMINEFLSNK